jgi:predicted AAA+ superfamily ATPase
MTKVTSRIFQRLLIPPKGSFFLFGPRGSGKTTWIQTRFSKAPSINLLDEGRYQTLLQNPAKFYEELSVHPSGSWVTVDEVQRLPNLLNEVHRLIEEKKFKFALTGSSARKLKRAGVNLLAGRAVRRLFYPLTPMEMGQEFDLHRALQFGTLPLIVHAEDPKDTLLSYVQMYLKEEIQAEAIVRNLGGFSRFLPIAALFHGQILNISNVARDAEISRPTANGFFEILEDTLLGHRLPAFESTLRVREKKHPKFYWIDPGILQSIKKEFSAPSQNDLGPLFEGLIFMLLSFQRDTFQEIDDLFYWSPAEAKQTEVDFLIQRGKEKIAIEVKATSRLRPEHFVGLKAIAELPQLKRRILIYLGREKLLKEGGIEVLPFGEFIEELIYRKI